MRNRDIVSVCGNQDRIIFDQFILPYDHYTAAIVAEDNGRPDWAYWLRNGRV